MPRRRRFSRDVLGPIVERFTVAQRSSASWAAYIDSLRHDDEADVVTEIMQRGRSIDALADMSFGYPASDLGDVISHVMADEFVRLIIEEPGDETVVTIVSKDRDGVEYEGIGRHERGWAKTESGRCILGDPLRPVSDEAAECVALAVVRAYLHMYRPDDDDASR